MSDKYTSNEILVLNSINTYNIHGTQMFVKFDKRESKLFKHWNLILDELLFYLKMICDHFEDKLFHEKLDNLLMRAGILNLMSSESIFTKASIYNIIEMLQDMANIQNDILVEKYLEGQKSEFMKKRNKEQIKEYLEKVEKDTKMINDKIFEYGNAKLIAESIADSQHVRDIIEGKFLK